MERADPEPPRKAASRSHRLVAVGGAPRGPLRSAASGTGRGGLLGGGLGGGLGARRRALPLAGLPRPHCKKHARPSGAVSVPRQHPASGFHDSDITNRHLLKLKAKCKTKISLKALEFLQL